MKFCHPEGARLALLSGHVVIVGTDWMELDPQFHQLAFAAGCHCDQTVIGARTNAPPGAAGGNQALDENANIRKAIILMIERGVEGDFTSAGNPNLNIVANLCGHKVEKESVLAVWHQLRAEAAAGDQEKAGTSTETALA